MPDKFENATLRAKTEQMFCVHTWKRNKCSTSTLEHFRWLFTFKIWQFELWEVLSWHSKVSIKFSRHYSGTTTSFTKLSHHALVLLVEPRSVSSCKADSVVLLLIIIPCHLMPEKTYSLCAGVIKQYLDRSRRLKKINIVKNTENILLFAMLKYWGR